MVDATSSGRTFLLFFHVCSACIPTGTISSRKEAGNWLEKLRALQGTPGCCRVSDRKLTSVFIALVTKNWLFHNVVCLLRSSLYGARHDNWPLFVIAAVLSSDVARRQLRYRCKAGNESYPTPKTACACDVRLLNYAWNNADWLTGDLWSWLSTNHQRLRYNGPNGHSDVA